MIKQWVAGAIFVALAGTATAQVARFEIIPISSVTLSDVDFLAGQKGGQPVTIAGELRLPRGGTDKLPAAILLHAGGGMGGTGSAIDEWSRELNQLGIATFAVDSLAGRGIVSVSPDQIQFGHLNMAVD
ncbi:MAG: carboxymethylenebutenolidase, partial [Bradyrhizobium sp.]|nr:carboxymethylenebutenolidase [Bradyrhizobium sp.]